MKKIKVYVAAHKKYEKLRSDIYVPLHVGSAFGNDLGFQKDNEKDNISNKNKNYCELTGIYWIWKNVKTDITGLVHYRRYFYKSIFSNKDKNILFKEDILNYLKEYDVIVSKKSVVPFGSVEKYYAKHHYQKDYDILREVIYELTPDYKEAFDKVSKSNYYYNLNMMICNKKIFDKYANWLFKILFEVEKRVDITNYSDYDKRIFGFLSEIMLRIWLVKNNYKLKECNVYNKEVGFGKQFIKRCLMNVWIKH